MTAHPDATPSTGFPAVDRSRGVPRRRTPSPAADSVREEIAFARAVASLDVLVVVAAVTAGMILGAGAGRAAVIYGVTSGGLLLAALPLSRAWEARVLGQGVTELVRLGRAVAAADIVLAFNSLVVLEPHGRVWVFGVVPATGALLLVERWTLRKWLHRRRAVGRFLLPVLAVGSDAAVADLVRRTRRDVHYGWQVTGVCTPTGAVGSDVSGVPVLGDLDAVPGVVSRGAHRVVAVSQAPGWGSARLQRLAWTLEGTSTDLAVDPGLMEIAGPRMHIAPVDGMPLLRLSHPRFTGVARLLKALVDRGVAALLLVALSPVLLAVAVAVRLHDGGPALFVQERVGANGRTFRMVKFRSMWAGAEADRTTLLDSDDGAGPLFKMRRDPRVTGVGRVLRRYSLDELPQLLNVLTGSMSLVGPRPPLPGEVDGFADDARRRLLVRPGMTGLWQVSGRSSLSWEESVRLDLRYVENWSPALDLVILWKTIGAVVLGRGAY